MNKLSIVIPVYNSAESLKELTSRLHSVLTRTTSDFEIIYINDASSDESWETLLQIVKTNSKIRAINLSRNFGQHAAISAGLKQARYNKACVMDCDLQDAPEDIPLLMQRMKEDQSDIVFTIKKQRKHSFFKNLTGNLFHLAINYLIKDKHVYSDGRIGSFSLLRRNVIDQFIRLKDTHRHYLLLLRWLGFKRSYVEIEHHPRKFGKSSYNLERLILHALDGITSQSDKLLFFSTKLSIFILFIVVTISLYVLYLKLTANTILPGWASLSLLVLISTSINLFFLGVVGSYIGKIFDQVKERPLYIIREEATSDQEE